MKCDLPVGRAGEIGPLQITPIVIQELHRRKLYDNGKQWEHERCKDLKYSAKICKTYLLAISPDGTYEDWARLWHRSSKIGMNSVAANRYWIRVSYIINAINSNEDAIRTPKRILHKKNRKI
jgi:hypothetical protein